MAGWSAFLLTLGGLAAGWALTQATEWLRRTDEYRRIYREVLSYLLDLYHVLQAVRVDLRPAVGQFVDALAAETNEPLVMDELGRHVAEYPINEVQNRLETLVGPRLAALKAGYSEAVQKLATIDPVLAYSLRNQDDFLLLLDEVRKMAGSVGIDSPEQAAAARQLFDTIAKPQILSVTSDKVRLMIRAVSRKLNRTTRRDVDKLVKKMTEEKNFHRAGTTMAQEVAKQLKGQG